ncbi:MAG: LysE family transporter [Aminivibrio sp.]|jgi:cysteine/O-acetylserine efflux protein
MEWTAFFTFVLISSHTPGPNIIFAMNTARVHGFTGALPLTGGMITGLLIVMTACAAFNLVLAALLPAMLPWLRIAGAAYIMWLAWKIAFPKSAPSGEGEAIPEAPGFRQGFFLQFLNPKVILFGLTTLSAFILPWTTSRAWLFGGGIFLALACFSGVMTWTVLGAIQKRVFKRQGRAVDAVMGALLAWCAYSVSGLGPL